jgi:protein TonB
MSKDPNTNAPPKGAAPESLEDLVYRPSLSEGRREVQKASPLITFPATVLTYAVFGLLTWQLAKHSDAIKKAVAKTQGIDLTEQKEDDAPPPPPPPPPAPAAPVAPARVTPREDVPPPPPLTNQDVVPEVAPRELPKENLSLAYAGAASGTGSGPSVAGVGVGGGTGMAVTGSGSSGHVQDVDYTQVKIKYQPPVPPYPPIARIARIQGTVVVQITIGVDGLPTSAKAIEGPVQLRPGAENYAMQWRFEPCMMGGVPIQARFTLNMPFKLR